MALAKKSEAPIPASATVSHELKTPLNAILGYVQLLMRDDSLSDNSLRRAKEIERAGKHLLSLITLHLETATAEKDRLSSRLGPVDIETLVEEVAGLFSEQVREKGLALTHRIDSDVPTWVITDAVRVRQILINLIGNGVKYTQSGGVHVLVSTRNMEEDRCTLLVEVMDTGPGVAKEDITRIFRSFDRSGAHPSVEGAGLGLAISEESAREMGGTLALQSTPGHGSVFRLSLPVAWLHFSEGRDAELRDSTHPEPPPSSTSERRGSGTYHTAERLVPLHLDEGLRSRLVSAARAADQESLTTLLAQLGEGTFAARCQGFVDAFDYSGLISLLAPQTAEHGSTFDK